MGFKTKQSRYNSSVLATWKLLKLQGYKKSLEFVNSKLVLHPCFPSLMAILDFLKYYNIRYSTFQVDLEDLNDVSLPMLTHHQEDGGQFIVLTSYSGGIVKYYNSYSEEKEESDIDFAKKWSNTAIIVEEDKLSPFDILNGHKPILKYAIFASLLLALSGLLNISNEFVLFYSFVLNTIGLALSFFILFPSFSSSITKPICKVSKYIDCTAVSESPLGKKLKLNIYGFIYFLTNFIYITFSRNGIDTLAFISVPVALFSIFLVYYQLFRIKKLCPLCLAVNVTVIAQFLLYIKLNQFLEIAPTNDLLLYLVSAVIAATISITLLKALILSKKNDYLNERVFYFMSFPKVLQHFLNESTSIPRLHHKNVMLESYNANETLTIILSPQCQHCKESIKKHLKSLIKSYSIELLFIEINSSNNKSNESLQLTLALMNTPIQYRLDLIERWYNGTFIFNDEFTENYTNQQLEEGAQLQKKLRNMLVINSITYVPSLLINNIKLPNIINIDDLDFFVNKRSN